MLLGAKKPLPIYYSNELHCRDRRVFSGDYKTNTKRKKQIVEVFKVQTISTLKIQFCIVLKLVMGK
jgi:hypothetical protein